MTPDPTSQQRKGYKAWLATRPPKVRKLVERFPPWNRYRMAKTGLDTYSTYSISEGGTLTVIRYSALTDAPMWRVFGVKPSDLILVPQAS